MKKNFGNLKLDSYEHQKLINPYKRKSYQKSRNKKSRKRYYFKCWKKWWSDIGWNVFWDFIEEGC